MEYYFYLLFSLASMLVGVKFLFCELEGRAAKKRNMLSWYLKLSQSFKYIRTRSLIFMCIVCYLIVSMEPFFSTQWFLEMTGFVAVGVIFDGIGQYIAYHYNRIRFKKDIKEALSLTDEINQAMEITGDNLVTESLPSYSSQEIINRYINENTHLATISLDGGEFVASLNHLPPITYAVEAQYEKAACKLQNRQIKVTRLTENGKLPFKDERIDVVVNELANYDKYDLYRIIKPGGYILVDQIGSDNYRELLNDFIPFKLKGRWDLETGTTTLSEIGLEIIDGVEEHGYVRFNTLASFIQFMKEITRGDIKQDRFLNFYGHVLKQIKEKSYFELTTHRFMIVARKKELN